MQSPLEHFSGHQQHQQHQQQSCWKPKEKEQPLSLQGLQNTVRSPHL